MHHLTVLLLGLAACSLVEPPKAPPAPGATSRCAKYGGSRIVSGGLAMCVRSRPARVGIGYNGGAEYVQLTRAAWLRNGPVEGTDPWGLHVAGWYRGNVREGAWRFTDDRGIVRAEGQYFAGYRNGTWTTRYDNGQVASVVRYWYGRKDGPAQFWYRDGSPWWQGRYAKYEHTAVGTWIHWSRDGVRTEVAADQKLHDVVGSLVDAVGPLAEPADFVAISDRECARNFVTLMWELRVRPDIVSTQNEKTLMFAWRGGAALGTIQESGESGEIADENGELVVRGTSRQPECRDVAGRRISEHEWLDERFPPP